MRRLLLGCAALAVACSVQQNNLSPGTQPSFEGFQGTKEQAGLKLGGVNGYLGRSCGSLDCHGQVGRGLRLYSETGLRMPEGRASDAGDKTPGLGPITPAEVGQNYLAVVALEPELMEQVVADGGDRPERLLLIRKPMGYDTHKGGRIFLDVTDPGYVCLTSWLAGKVDEAQCRAGWAFQE